METYISEIKKLLPEYEKRFDSEKVNRKITTTEESNKLWESFESEHCTLLSEVQSKAISLWNKHNRK